MVLLVNHLLLNVFMEIRTSNNMSASTPSLNMNTEVLSRIHLSSSSSQLDNDDDMVDDILSIQRIRIFPSEDQSTITIGNNGRHKAAFINVKTMTIFSATHISLINTGMDEEYALVVESLPQLQHASCLNMMVVDIQQQLHQLHNDNNNTDTVPELNFIELSSTNDDLEKKKMKINKQ